MLEEILGILYRPITDRIDAQTTILNIQLGALVADAQQLQQAVTDLQTSLGAALQRVEDDVRHLQETQGVDPAALDPIVTQIQSAKQSLDALDPDASFPPEEPGTTDAPPATG